MPKKPPKAGRFWRARKTAQCRCYVLIKRRFPSYLRTGQRAALREHREHREHREQEALKHRRDETEAGSCSFFRPTHPTSEQREKHTMATQPQRARSAHRRGTKEPTLLPPPSDSPGNGAGSGGGHDCGINPTRDGAVPDGYIDLKKPEFCLKIPEYHGTLVFCILLELELWYRIKL